MPEETSSPTYLRDLIASGRSVYGDPATNPAAIEALARENARLRLSASLGEIELPAATDYDKEARETRLHAECGPPLAAWEPSMSEFLKARIEALGALSEAEFLRSAEAVASDCGNRASPVTLEHSRYRLETADYPHPAQIVDAMTRDARPALAELVEPANLSNCLRALRADRALLELFAARGRRMATYSERRRALGLPS
jgi:hypothetical protein